MGTKSSTNCKRMKLGEYEVGEAELSYVERLAYEVDGLRVLIVNLSSLVGTDEIHPIYERLKDEYQQKFAERQIALNELVKQTAPDCMDDPNVVFMPDFYRGVLVAYES